MRPRRILSSLTSGGMTLPTSALMDATHCWKCTIRPRMRGKVSHNVVAALLGKNSVQAALAILLSFLQLSLTLTIAAPTQNWCRYCRHLSGVFIVGAHLLAKPKLIAPLHCPPALAPPPPPRDLAPETCCHFNRTNADVSHICILNNNTAPQKLAQIAPSCDSQPVNAVPAWLLYLCHQCAALVMLLHCLRSQRSVSCSAEILEAPGSSHLVITHKSMARAFLCTALALPPTSFRSLDMNNGGVSIFRCAMHITLHCLE